jgi:hypothetical protein
VYARRPLDDRGLRIPQGDSAVLEMLLWHFGDEPIEVGTRWFTDRSGGRTIENVVINVIGRFTESPTLESWDTESYVSV